MYLCDDLKHDRKVALKLLKPELAAVLGAERLVQEIKTTAALQHPHILPLFDSGAADGFLFYVMPFIDGETLRAKLDRETPEARRLLRVRPAGTTRASATSRAMRTASSTPSCVSRSSFARNVSPSMNGITIEQESVGGAAVEQRQDMRMLQRRGVLISCTKRSAPSTAASSGLSSLSATLRSCFKSSNRYTVAIPPSPRCRSMR